MRIALNRKLNAAESIHRVLDRQPVDAIEAPHCCGGQVHLADKYIAFGLINNKLGWRIESNQQWSRHEQKKMHPLTTAIAIKQSHPRRVSVIGLRNGRKQTPLRTGRFSLPTQKTEKTQLIFKQRDRNKYN